MVCYTKTVKQIPMPRNAVNTEEIIEQLKSEIGSKLTTGQIKSWAESNNLSPNTILNRLANHKVARGQFDLDQIQQLESTYTMPAASNPTDEVKTIVRDYDCLVPEVDKLYVAFGNHRDVMSIIKSRIFYPTFITGLSGNGKTHTVDQVCAKLKRDLIRVNITIETDQDDLIGGFRLVNGETAWHNGPVIEAMVRGAVLLLDEIDLASNKILCIQSVLEGKGVYVKKINKWIHPAPGFNVIATANTKGRGSESGRFIGTNVLNEAFLERFAVTFEQDYPSVSVEKKILGRLLDNLGCNDDKGQKMVHNLTSWAEIIRKTYNDGGVDDLISTRRLVNVLKAYSIFGNVSKAIHLCTNRFDDDTKKVFCDLYEKISGEEEAIPETPTDIEEDDECSFPYRVTTGSNVNTVTASKTSSTTTMVADDFAKDLSNAVSKIYNNTLANLPPEAF